MVRVHTFNVTPSLPEPLEALLELAYDLFWSWDPDARSLFRRIDPKLWESLNHNPVALLGDVSQDVLDKLSTDDAFLTHMQAVMARLVSERQRATWFERKHGDSDMLVAYFCAEYGLTEALPIYSGGLGVLAGDTLKSSAAIGLPMVAVGLAYQEGYFRQYLNEDGWQQEAPYENDFARLPMRRARTASGDHVAVTVEIEGRPVRVRVWEVAVGAIRLYLLDTNSPKNSDYDRAITAQLYGGGTELRFKQEIVLGIGGVRALKALGHQPTVYHMNEGHSAFLVLERIAELRRETGLSFAEAREYCAASNAFTTHTPVPAGFDIFSRDQLNHYLPKVHEELGITREEFLAMGGMVGDPTANNGFNMAYLALRNASRINGVSQLHGRVAREMWRPMWPGAAAHEVPIVGITNGIHTRTWVSADMGQLLDRYIGSGWRFDVANQEIWKRVESIPGGELWATHERRRQRLVAFVRERVHRAREKKGLPTDELMEADELLDPNTLTIGFARRFATYKRATLLFRDKDRLRRLITDETRPVQFIFAGKAHPKDEPGKQLIREIIRFSRDPAVRRRVVFLEEYDMGVAREMTRGVDVWLNTPRRPKEASGTSGMKVVPNGGLNLSVLDGWWHEGYDGDNGWSIGAGEEYEDVGWGDAIEARLLMDIIESKIVDEFYDRGHDRLPRRWIRRMKKSMIGLSGFFSTDRMMQQYAEQVYLKCHAEAAGLIGDDYAGARDRAKLVAELRREWGRVRIGEVSFGSAEGPREVAMGQELTLEADVFLGTLTEEAVIVEIFGGRVDRDRSIIDGALSEMAMVTGENDGWYRFKGTFTPEDSGHSGLTVRVRPALDNPAPARSIPIKYWGG